MPTIDKERDDRFIAVWNASGGSPANAAKALGISVRGVQDRRNTIERRYGIRLPSLTQTEHKGRGDLPLAGNDYLQRVTVDGFDGKIVVFSDAHFWPGRGRTLAFRALLEVVKELKPKLVIANGDVFDGARLSRFPRNGWEYQPKVRDELEEAKACLDEIRQAAGRARFIRTIGNHCIRFDRYLSVHASEMEMIHGARLSDHLQHWQECVSVFVNGDTMIKHRFHGGIHAAYNNTLRAGTNIVTGHTHLLEVKPWSDYRGRRYGVQTGALADVDGPQFGYTEDNPTPWCSGFAMLTVLKDGSLLYPDLCEVKGNAACFRGELLVRGK